jgi:RNA polymerase sigma-70 factor, ECF subfamily
VHRSAIGRRADERLQGDCDTVPYDYLCPDEADHTAGPRTGGFRRRAALVGGTQADRAVARAVARAQEGDREAIRFLYVRFADNVYGYVRSLVRDDHESEDITQQVFAKLITVIGQYEERSSAFPAWILRVAHNVAVDAMRRPRPLPCEEMRDAYEPGEDESAVRALGLGEALDRLSEDQRSVLVLRHVVGASPVEIAARLGKTEASIHGLHHRGRRALQHELRHMGLAPQTASVAA